MDCGCVEISVWILLYGGKCMDIGCVEEVYGYWLC